MIEDIAKLDELNMALIIAESGGLFSVERRTNALKKEIESGSLFVTQYESETLLGYVQYSEKENGEIYVVSIQIHPKYQNGITLRKLLTKTAIDLLSRNPLCLTSSVHINNQQSIRFHRGLGFSEEKADDRILFSLSGDRLNDKLCRLAAMKK